MGIRFTVGSLIALVAVTPSLGVTPLGTDFIYQGQLKENGAPIDGATHLRFSLWDAAGSDSPPVGGNQIGASQLLANVAVTNGLFTVSLNAGGQFGDDAFVGRTRWLQVEVCADAGCGTLTILSPRQELTAAPNALNADRLDGLNSTAFLQSVPVPLSLTGSIPGSIIQGRNNWTDTGASGVLGFATDSGDIETYGVYGLCNSTGGHGVHGAALAATGVTYGMYGESASTSGIGVYGTSTAASGFTFGGRFESTSPAGVGVLGLGDAAGMHGVTSSSFGYGVFGEATNGQGGTWGVVGTTSGTEGRGVVGIAHALTGSTFGVFGESDSDTGRGVAGYVTAETGETYGVYGRTSSTSFNAAGVYGASTAGSGNNYGVRGESASTTGRGVLGSATATTGLTAGGRFASASTGGRGVWASATATTGATYGVYGQSDSPNGGTGVFGVSSGRGVEGQSFGLGGIGVAGVSSGGGSVGVMGVSGSPSGLDFYANGAGVDFGSSSSRRWKSDIEPIAQPLDKLGRLRGVYFNWDAKHGGRHDLGMIAEEVGAVLPEIVGYEENGIDAMGMDYSKMTPLLVEGVNALRAEKDAELAALRAERDVQISEQQERINALTARLERLEKVMSQTGQTRNGTD